MKIIIAPAKQIHKEADFEIRHEPEFMKEAEGLHEVLSHMPYRELKDLWQCNDRLAGNAFHDLHHSEPSCGNLPALLAYNGIQYKYMAPEIFTDEEWDYVDDHLRILSGFYGLVRPLDGIIPYRLEMQAGLSVDGHKTLYKFWGDRLYKSLYKENNMVINLASKEYSDAVSPFLKEKDRWVEVTFAVEVKGKVRTKATWAKMARGEMVRYLAEHKAGSPEVMKGFSGQGYQFDPGRSTNDHYLFIKES